MHRPPLDTGPGPGVRPAPAANAFALAGVQPFVRSAIAPYPRLESTDVSDADLVAAAQRGSPAAEELLVHRHTARVYRLAWRIAGDAEVARDLVQDVFVRVLSMLPRFRGEAAFTTWLHRVTVTTCLNEMRRIRRASRGRVTLAEAANVTASEHGDPAVLAAIHEAIHALPDSLRLPLVLHTLEGLSHREVAEMLDLTEGTCKRRVFEARAALRAALGESIDGGGR